MSNRWGLSALLTRLRGGELPGDDGRLLPEGFVVGDLGPTGLMGKGQEECQKEVRRVEDVVERARGCPFVEALN